MQLKTIFTLFLILFSFNVLADDTASCNGEGNLDIPAGNIETVAAVAREADPLFNVNIYHVTALSEINAGKAKVYVTKVDGKIDVRLNALGIKRSFKDRLSVEDLMAGKSVEFYAERDESNNGIGNPLLVITPEAGFSESGGGATLKILKADGEYANEQIYVGSVENDFRAMKGRSSSGREISGLNINVKGLSLKSLHTDSYTLNTK